MWLIQLCICSLVLWQFSCGSDEDVSEGSEMANGLTRIREELARLGDIKLVCAVKLRKRYKYAYKKMFNAYEDCENLGDDMRQCQIVIHNKTMSDFKKGTENVQKCLDEWEQKREEIDHHYYGDMDNAHITLRQVIRKLDNIDTECAREVKQAYKKHTIGSISRSYFACDNEDDAEDQMRCEQALVAEYRSYFKEQVDKLERCLQEANVTPMAGR